MNLHQLAKDLGGEVSGGQVLAPGPGHASLDRSLAVRLDKDAPDGFVVHSFAGDDAMECRDHVRAKAGLRAWEPGQGKRIVAEYVYRDEQGEPVLKVSRFDPKGFSQSRPQGGGWAPGGVERSKLVPYRLSDLLEAIAAGATVYVVEGEKSADALAERGLAATCSPGGAGKWPWHFSKWFAGARVVILPDNDAPGRQHAEAVKANLFGVAAAARIVALPGLKPKGDVFDYLRSGGDPDAIEAMPSAAATVLADERRHGAANDDAPRIFAASEFAGRQMKPRPWLVRDWFPGKQVSVLDGVGGGGKSTIALQLCVCAVTGRAWMGQEVTQGPAFYLSSEDDEDEIHRRLHDIGAHYRVGFDDLTNLHVWPLAAGDPVLVMSDRGDALKATDRWNELEAAIERIKPVVLVLDSRADVFGGDEINRAQARGFVAMLRRLALTRDLAVILLSHPSLSGIASGSGGSGSTHWRNAVRAGVYLKHPDDQDAHPDTRIMEGVKANYSPKGMQMTLRWSAGAFETDGAPPLRTGQEEALAKADATFVKLLQTYTAQGRHVTDQPSVIYAPAVFAKDPDRDGITRAGFMAAMLRLFKAEKIRVVESGPPSKRRRYLAVVDLAEAA